MSPKIYTEQEVAFLVSLFERFRKVITDDCELYGFSLQEYDEVMKEFPNVDLHDEGPEKCDHSWLVLNNMFAFLCANKPIEILSNSENQAVSLLWEKLKNL